MKFHLNAHSLSMRIGHVEWNREARLVTIYIFQMYNSLAIYLLLDVCISMRNYHLPHGGYFHHSNLAVHHDNNYHEHYDSYTSEEVMMHQRQSPRRAKYRYFDYSNSEYNYKCKCSCNRCQKRKPKPKPCCEDFCATECVQNNILVVPYPVPFMVFNQSAPDLTVPPMPPPTTTTTTTTEEPTTPQTTPPTRKTVTVTFSTVPYYQQPYKRFQIISDQNLRRNMGMGNTGIRSPHKFDRLPKYGIIPIPENLALSLMQQIRKDQNNAQFKKRLS